MNDKQQNQKSQPLTQVGQAEAKTGQAVQDSRSGGLMGQGVAPGQPGSSAVSGAGRQVGQLARAQPAATLLPPVDIYEDDGGFLLIADMPGVAKEQLVVRVTGDNLLIEGSASVPASASMALVYGEIPSPQYRRSFTLSRELDPGKIEASLNNGVLRLRIPKLESAKPRRIEVSVG